MRISKTAAAVKPEAAVHGVWRLGTVSAFSLDFSGRSVQ
jgi:hypothetical protein